ncbi:glutamine-hydrolyzing GMP synthase [Treponema sp. OttesenSCG-928-L16]|nr:glutamine-hydrolyzing GMP synthase [Treponema sp. OttesenSCG-928-L16]
MRQDLIVILDMGSEENSRLARAIRGLGVYSEIYPHDITEEELKRLDNVRGVILNGGKNRMVDGRAVDAGAWLYEQDIPLLLIDHSGGGRGPGLPSLPLADGELQDLLRPFLFDTCQAAANWNMDNFIADQLELLRRQIGGRKVLLALSGGVDSSVVAALLIKAVGGQLHCVHVNHGLMRKGESEQVIDVFRRQLGANLIYVDAAERFLSRLEGAADPERKRKIIGEEFIRVFEEEAAKLGEMDFLAQGTIYPDIVESGTKTSGNVKSHHNVGGLPEDLGFELVEPIKFLFKDEVRSCGLALGLPEDMVFRQPFPGPGLGVRCLGAITRSRLEILREADAVLRDEFHQNGLEKKVWQYFAVVPELCSTGVKDGKRSFEYPVILRAVNTIDAMTAEIECPPWPVLQRLTDRILTEVPGVNRVLYDMSPKPPATIEWE